MPDVEDGAGQRTLRIERPNTPRKYERRTGFTRQAQFASERRARPVKRSIRLRYHFPQLTFRSGCFFRRWSHLDQNAIRAVSTHLLSWLRIGTKHQAGDANGSQADCTALQK